MQTASTCPAQKLRTPTEASHTSLPERGWIRPAGAPRRQWQLTGSRIARDQFTSHAQHENSGTRAEIETKAGNEAESAGFLACRVTTCT